MRILAEIFAHIITYHTVWSRCPEEQEKFLALWDIEKILFSSATSMGVCSYYKSCTSRSFVSQLGTSFFLWTFRESFTVTASCWERSQQVFTLLVLVSDKIVTWSISRLEAETHMCCKFMESVDMIRKKKSLKKTPHIFDFSILRLKDSRESQHYYFKKCPSCSSHI